MRLTCIFFTMLVVLTKPPAALGGQHAVSLPFDLYVTLAESISLAIQNNRDLINARLDRAIQKFALTVAEDEFVPDATIKPSARFDSTEDWEGGAEVISEVTLRVPTGGQFAVSWNDKTLSTIGFTQPLLKGGGVTVNTASLKTARLQEEVNILALRAAVSNTVDSVIAAYRSLIQAERRLDIHTRSLQRARDLLATNQVLIQAGRMAEHDIIQSEADVANRELSLIEARDDLDAAQLALLGILDIDSRARVQPTEELVVNPAELDVARSMESALQHRTDHLQALLQIEMAEMELLVAKNHRLWDLSATYSKNVGDTGDTGDTGDSQTVRLELNIPFGDLSPKQRYMRADIALKQSRNRLAELRQTIHIEVRDAVRRVDVRFRQIELARRTRELSERKLEVEKEKLNLGLTSNFRVVAFEDDLVRAQDNEVQTAIAYLNALTGLDRTLGTTLETWQIDIERFAER